ncbi:hypothetical protein [Chitinimonas sp. JJ19]|uniref:hypothetical protein n=1 Tax=Chitinimonas sp. JJ19 TaxID=3109352 RepID=UPI001A636314|nr:hypothetical protein [Chitinimonas sp.]
MPQVINRRSEELPPPPATNSTATGDGSDPASPAPVAEQQLDMLIGAMAGFAPMSMGNLAASSAELERAAIVMAVSQP